MTNISDLWYSKDEREWQAALARYWDRVKPGNVKVEREMDSLDSKQIQNLNIQGWHNFLRDKYFPWKYTHAFFLKINLNRFKYYESNNAHKELFEIKEQIFTFNKDDIRLGLEITQRIHGLGTAGASGLLSILFPDQFGTVDQFVVKALREITDLHEREAMKKINPTNLTPSNGVILIQLLRAKAQEMNDFFFTKDWTPRKIDMALWGYRADENNRKNKT